MTIRLSISSLAGTARTLVAVGTSSDADMFLTTAAAAPRSVCSSSPSAGGGLAALTRAGAARSSEAVPAGAGGGGGGLAGGRGAGCRFAGRLGVVVDEELMPARIDRRRVVAELAVHLLDQPFVLPEW